MPASGALQVGHGSENRIKQPKAQPPRPALRPAGALADDHMMALPPLGHHVGDDLRRVLQVPINQHHTTAGGMVNAGRDGRLMAEIP